MELDPAFVEAFANLQVSTSEISAKQLDKFDENAPLNPPIQVKHPSYEHVPQFFHVPPPPGDELQHLLRREANMLLLHQKSEEVLTNDEQDELWTKLKDHTSETTTEKGQLISYDDYCKLQSVVGKKCRKYLTAQLFAQLLSESQYLDSVEIASILNYTVRKVLLTQYRIGLSLYDKIGHGYLREFDLNKYILDKIPTLIQIRDHMLPAFEKLYVCTVVKRFFFFLDPLRTGRIPIRELLASGMINQLMELGKEPQAMEPFDEVKVLAPNEFSMPEVLNVYAKFLALDLDHNGLLSKKELAAYGSGTLTSFFLDRIYEECPTHDGEMDYKTFMEFTLVMENRQTSSSLHFLFRMLDVHQTGYLTSQTLQYFIKGLQEQMLEFDVEPIRLEDINNQIFDMVKPNDPCKITLQDLSTCRQAETVVSILIEFHKFWAYENRDDSPQDA